MHFCFSFWNVPCYMVIRLLVELAICFLTNSFSLEELLIDCLASECIMMFRTSRFQSRNYHPSGPLMQLRLQFFQWPSWVDSLYWTLPMEDLLIGHLQILNSCFRASRTWSNLDSFWPKLSIFSFKILNDFKATQILELTNNLGLVKDWCKCLRCFPQAFPWPVSHQ